MSFFRSSMTSFSRARKLHSEDDRNSVAPVDVLLDKVGDDPDVGMPRRWKEDCRSYRLRLQIFLQEEIIRRERFESFLALLLGERR